MTNHASEHVGVPLSAEAWRRVLIVMEKLAFSSNLDEILSIAHRRHARLPRRRPRQRLPVRPPPAASSSPPAPHGVGPSPADPPPRAASPARRVRTREIINVHRLPPGRPLQTPKSTCAPAIPPRRSSPSRSCRSTASSRVSRRCSTSARNPGPRGHSCDRRRAGPRPSRRRAAVAIRRARLIEAERRKTKIEADLRIARDIQIRRSPPLFCPSSPDMTSPPTPSRR